MAQEFSLVQHAASLDELLSQQIAEHFAAAAPFPTHPEFSRFGHQKNPPTPFGEPWLLQKSEPWLVHALGSYYLGFENGREFKSAGAAAILVTDQAVLLKLGVGGPSVVSQFATSTHLPDSQLHQQRLRFPEILEVGAGDLLRVRGWRNDQFKNGLIFKLDWPRSVAALILGLRANVLAPKELMDAAIDVTEKNNSKIWVLNEGQDE